MHLEPAVGTVVNADTEVLGDHRVTLAAFLRGTAWVHANQLTPGAFSLSFKDSCGLSPRGVETLPREHTAPKGFEVEVFDRDSVVLLDHGSCELVVEVSPLVRDLGVSTSLEASCFRAVAATEFTASCAALCSRELALCGLQRAWVLDEVPVCEGRESLNADVDTRLSPRRRQRLRRNLVANEMGVPRTVGVEPDADLLKPALVRTMELDLDLTDTRELQPLIPGHHLGTVAVRDVFEHEALVPVSSLEARIARLDGLAGFGFFASTEERLERFVQSRDGLLQQVRVNVCELWSQRANFDEGLLLVVARRALTSNSVRVPSLLQRGVVQLAKQVECPEKRTFLRGRRVQPIPIRSLHPESIVGSGQRATSPSQFQRRLSNRLPFGSRNQGSAQGADRPHDRSCAGHRWWTWPSHGAERFWSALAKQPICTPCSTCRPRCVRATW